MTTLQEQIHQDLKSRYSKSTLTLSETATELSLSYSSLNKHISKGIGIPNFRRIGPAKNGRIVFNISDISKFLADTVETM